MNQFKKIVKSRLFLQIVGLLISGVAIFYCLRKVNFHEVWAAFKTAHYSLFPLVILLDLTVVFLKAYRWKILIQPVTHIGTFVMFRIVMISFLFNNIFPAKLGEVARIHLVGKKTQLSRITATSSLLADKLIEGLTFLVLVSGTIFIFPVPTWLFRSFLITLGIIGLLFLLARFFSHFSFERPILQKFHAGLMVLRSHHHVLKGVLLSLGVWVCQIVLLFVLHQAFDIEIPLWGIILILLSVNLAIALPAAPSHLGTFELGCILIYSFLGLDPNMALVLAMSYHFLQVIPLCITGGGILLHESLRRSQS